MCSLWCVLQSLDATDRGVQLFHERDEVTPVDVAEDSDGTSASRFTGRSDLDADEFPSPLEWADPLCPTSTSMFDVSRPSVLEASVSRLVVASSTHDPGTDVPQVWLAMSMLMPMPMPMPMSMPLPVFVPLPVPLMCLQRPRSLRRFLALVAYVCRRPWTPVCLRLMSQCCGSICLTLALTVSCLTGATRGPLTPLLGPCTAGTRRRLGGRLQQPQPQPPTRPRQCRGSLAKPRPRQQLPRPLHPLRPP